MTPSASSWHSEMSFFEHLVELRYRLLISVAAIAVGSIFGFLYSKQAFDLISQPFFASFPNDILIGTGPAEAFMLRLKLSVFLGFLLAIPVVFLQIWLFIAPGLHEHERKMAIPFVFISSVLFLVGVLFCFAVVLPFSFEFFKGQYEALGNVTPTIRVQEYLSLLLKALLGFGLVFEMPVMAFFLARLGLIDEFFLIRSARYATVIIFLVSAILTPPDVLTQLLMAGPLLVLYALSILIVKFAYRKSPSPGEPQQPSAPTTTEEAPKKNS